MLIQTKTFYNAVIDGDLFMVIYDYLRFHPAEIKEYYHIQTTSDFDNLSVEDWKDLAEDAIYWLDHNQLNKVEVRNRDDNAPSMNTWGTLYYQTLNYMAIKNIVGKTTFDMSLGELIDMCRSTIEYLKEKIDEIHEVTEEDLKNI